MSSKSLFEKGKAILREALREKEGKVENSPEVTSNICSGCKSVVTEEYCPYCRTVNPFFRVHDAQIKKMQAKQHKKL